MNPRRLLYILVATLLTLAVTDSPQIFASSSETEAAASSSAPRKKSKRKILTQKLQKEIQLPFAEQETYIHPPQVFQTRSEDP